MRFVDLDKLRLPTAWLANAKKLQSEIEALSTIAEKLAHIDANPIWQDKTLFKALSDLMNGKCWYSEAQDLMSDRDVDHFRPKKRAKNLNNVERDGYWFLAYDWENYRFSSIYSNRLRKDKFSEDDLSYGKGIFFPLKDGTNAALTKRQLLDERPYLIDPTKKTDASLVSFNSFGKVIPNVPKAFLWDRERVSASTTYYHLNHSPLKEARKKMWNRCQVLINEIIQLCSVDDRTLNDDIRIENIKKELIEMSSEHELLSGVVIACLNKNNLSGILTI